MTKITSLVLIIVLFVFSSPLIFSQKNKASEVKRIDAYTSSVDAYLRKHKNPHTVFADVSDDGQDKPKWKKFASTQVLEKFREETEVNDIANTWLRNNGVILSVMTLSSGSGDWAKYLYLYFREDGTLAKSESELRTFHGDFIARQEFYFNPKGKLLKKTLKYFDLKTEKPKKPDSSDLGDNSPFINDDNYYLKTSELPFAHLIKTNKK